MASNELDLVFCMDCTGSMGPYIDQAKQSVLSIITDIIAAQSCEVQFGLVEYRDHNNQDQSAKPCWEYVTRVSDFTTSKSKIEASVNQMSPNGGGDGPEAVAPAYSECLNALSWRPNSVKFVIHVSDAPPHGIEPTGDSYPNGDPSGIDPLEVAREMKERGVVVYPVLAKGGHSYTCCAEFYRGIAHVTGGQFITLHKAHVLGKLITACAAEELSLKEIEAELTRIYEAEADKEQVKKNPEAFIERATKKVNAKGHRAWGNMYSGAEDCSAIDREEGRMAQVYATHTSLSSAKNKIAGKTARPAPQFKDTDDKISYRKSAVCTQQTRRMASKMSFI